jgi:hypothetical protein
MQLCISLGFIFIIFGLILLLLIKWNNERA